LLRYQKVASLPKGCFATKRLLRYQKVASLPKGCFATAASLLYFSHLSVKNITEA